MSDLKTCPFCGSLPTRKVVRDRLSVECPNCVSVGFHNHIRLGCLADQQWNNRTEDVAVHSTSNNTGSPKLKCKGCGWTPEYEEGDHCPECDSNILTSGGA